MIQRQIDATDKQIDGLVYVLHDLSVEEMDRIGLAIRIQLGLTGPAR